MKGIPGRRNGHQNQASGICRLVGGTRRLKEQRMSEGTQVIG